MAEFFLAFLIIAAAMLCIGLGLVLRGRAPSGSCGGLAAFLGGGACQICGNRKNCKRKPRE